MTWPHESDTSRGTVHALPHRRGVPHKLVLLCLLASGCLDPSGPEVRKISDVRRVNTEARPSTAEFEATRPGTLPDVWKIAERQRVQSGWYRVRLSLPEAPGEPWAVYVPRFSQSIEVFVNDRWIGSSGRIRPPLTRNWNRPLLLPIPKGTLRAGANDLEMHLVVQKTAPGFLRPVFVGPQRALESAYRLRYFLQVTCARYGAVLMATVAMILGFIALRREEFRSFRFFTAGCLFWALASGELFLAEPPMPARDWQLLAMTSAGVGLLLFTQAAHRSFGKSLRWIEVLLCCVLAGIAVGMALVPDRWFEVTGLLLWSFCAIVGTYMVVLFVFSDRPALPRARALIVLGFAALVIGIHDVLLALWVPIPPSVFLAPILSLVAAFWGAWIVIDHFLSALRESEMLNRELEQRVATKHAELEANFERLRELERERAVDAERERLMREMHDGMGGQLVSALAMAEDGETRPPQIADVLRGALDDMRLVIDSLDPVIDDVPTLLGMIRGRIEPRLRAHGIRFDWHVTDLPRTEHFGPEQFLDVLRIAQEAITNVVKHADAGVIRVETEETAGPAGQPGIQVTIGDDGSGMPTGAGANQGRGLSNMQARADRLQGTLRIESRPGEGTIARLWIPTNDMGRRRPRQ